MSEPRSVEILFAEVLDLLKKLIASPSLSREEEKTGDCIEQFLKGKGIKTNRSGNNIWASNLYFDSNKPTVLLNSHHDTVKPNAGYTKDPFSPIVEDGKLYGLGSNDAGGCLVSLVATFLHFYEKKLPYNIVIAASAEEEISGANGIASILKKMPVIEFGIVGEPTEMKMAVAEKGLMVLDCESKGVAGHAARSEGKNAIYKAMMDVEWFQKFEFENVSGFLGPIHMSVTQIEAGSQHNVIPDRCRFVVDVRTTDAYSNEETLKIICSHVDATVTPRSTRLNPSHLPESLHISQVADQLKIEKYGSPTLSDQALMPFPTCKMGPGKSERSHTADEFIYVEEIEEGIHRYIQLLETLFENKNQQK